MILEGRNLSLIYDMQNPNPTYAVRDISIRADQGEMIGIVGPSGSGKSSLLYMLSGLKTPTLGTVYYDDMDLGIMSSEQRAIYRRTHFGLIFQNHFLIDYLNVLDNILVAFEKVENRELQRAEELLERLGIKSLRNRYPHELSVGQKQRTAVARALAANPEVLFADEPTASLDHQCAMDVMRAIGEARGQTTILVVTHDKSILDDADRILEIWDGQLFENRRKQSPHVLLSKPSADRE